MDNKDESGKVSSVIVGNKTDWQAKDRAREREEKEREKKRKRERGLHLSLLKQLPGSFSDCFCLVGQLRSPQTDLGRFSLFLECDCAAVLSLTYHLPCEKKKKKELEVSVSFCCKVELEGD